MKGKKLETRNKNMLFRTGQAPSPYKTFESFFFNSPEHIARQGNDRVTLFEWVSEKNNLVNASIWVFENGNRAISPFKSSFGSLEFTPKLSLTSLLEFIDKICHYLLKKKFKTFFIRSWPLCYAPHNASLLHTALLQSGFTVNTTDLNFHVPVNETSLPAGMDISERNRFNKAKKNGFTVRLLDPDLYLKSCYALFKKTVASHRAVLSMSFQRIQDAFHLFQQNYFLFGAFNKEEKLTAASVCVSVNSNVLYVFYLGYDTTFATYSPLVFLINGIYDFCKEKNFTIMDLGIATEKGKPNYGLIHFKRNLGGIASLKLSYEKVLDDELMIND